LDAATIADDQHDEKTELELITQRQVPTRLIASLPGPHRLRKANDERAGQFLRALTRLKRSRVLITSRLYPADLEKPDGQAAPGTRLYFLPGLKDADALALWRALGVSGSRHELLAMFHTFDNHPLLIHALAATVAHHHRAPGNFALWRRDNPRFDPFSLPLAQARSHVLRFALHGLSEDSQDVLHTMAAFVMPCTYDTLASVLVGPEKRLASESVLDTVQDLLSG
ncbi:MAG: hypothetical protein HYY05_03820, partial [Chloroflexi bacterium]|nr:hypothetical protein [Chloroflexota bacterium]